jgi:hypothetical protein
MSFKDSNINSDDYNSLLSLIPESISGVLTYSIRGTISSGIINGYTFHKIDKHVIGILNTNNVQIVAGNDIPVNFIVTNIPLTDKFKPDDTYTTSDTIIGVSRVSILSTNTNYIFNVKYNHSTNEIRLTPASENINFQFVVGETYTISDKISMSYLTK